MDDRIVRVERIKIYDLKNVEQGELVFANPRRPEGASALGLYGQNGSGKSSLVDALEMVQLCMAGFPLDRKYARYINVNANYARIECEMSIEHLDAPIFDTATYSFSLRSEEAIEEIDELQGEDEKKPLNTTRVFDEKLEIRTEMDGKRRRKEVYIDTSRGTLFIPDTKRKLLVGGFRGSGIELVVQKELAYRESRSFVFSPALYNFVANRAIPKERGLIEEVETFLRVIASLRRFARAEFFILNTRDFGATAAGALPFISRLPIEDGYRISSFFLPIEGPKVVPLEIYEQVKPSVEVMNIVLRQLVPELTVSVEDLGRQMTKNGEDGVNIQLASVRNGERIPLSCESGGIKRIISFLNLMILMYNDPSVTIVIDELDAGVFEYLLGELLSIVTEHGRGQLIFTSHNLRPLETIDRGFIAFTTTNPQRRYWRMTDVKPTNNLRDFYYRDIILGGQDEPLYERTNNGEIEFALMEAGEAIEA